MKIVPGAVLWTLVPCLGRAAAFAPADPNPDGSGWSMVWLDLDVWVLPEEERMELEGAVQLRLDQHDSSWGPNLLLNIDLTDSGDPVMAFEEVECPSSKVEIESALRSGSIRQTTIRFAEPKLRGEEVLVEFAAGSQGMASQLVVRDVGALASWTSAWHPFTNSTSKPRFRFEAGTLHAPGRTRLHLPADWIGIVDGALRERHRSATETVEEWETPKGIARSFAAGPYRAMTKEVDGRQVNVYLLAEDKKISAESLVRLVARSMEAQEKCWGPFPFDSYSLVEAPTFFPSQWAAASNQTFIMARSFSFDYEHGNVPLWGHEMAHAWWGNTVGSRGGGSQWVGEALAQVGALIAIEALEGPESLRQFLAYSREEWSPLQCAKGYFALLREGQDQPVAQMSQGATHSLADSKGVWVHHMLRQRIGSDRYHRVLRGAIQDFTHRQLTMDELRRRFLQVAPEEDLETFFSQWLDRTGAPIVDVDWYAKLDGHGIVLHLTQMQDGAPFVFDCDVEIELEDGGRVIQEVPVAGGKEVFVLETPSRAVGVHLDPEFKLLLWRPEYGPRPGDTITGVAEIPAELIAAVVGDYRMRERVMDLSIFVEEGSLYLRLGGQTALRFTYDGDGKFRMDLPGEPMVLEFDTETVPAAFLTASGEHGFHADRREGR